MNLFDKIIGIYSNLTIADFLPITGTIVLQNDGQGDYIAKWEHPTLPKPTAEQLA
jgi:hypothetical protein